MQCEVISRYFLAVQALWERQKAPRDYGTGETLYQSEINFIEAVSRHPHSNAIQLSRRLHVTRAAVTQWGTRLEQKGIIARYITAGNKKEKYYALTELGKTILGGYRQYHLDANRRMCSYLSGLQADERRVIMDFLEKAALLPINAFECAHAENAAQRGCQLQTARVCVRHTER